MTTDPDLTPMTFKEALEFIMSALKMVGTGNATAAIAAGAAYNSLASAPAVRGGARLVIFAFLLGAVIASFSYLCLILGRVAVDQANLSLEAHEADAMKKHLKSSSVLVLAAFVFGATSAILFYFGMIRSLFLVWEL